MRLTLKYFASIKEAVGIASEAVEIGPDVVTVLDLLNWLCKRGEPWSTAIDTERGLRCAINHEVVELSAGLPEGAEVALFPPVTGG